MDFQSIALPTELSGHLPSSGSMTPDNVDILPNVAGNVNHFFKNFLFSFPDTMPDLPEYRSVSA